MSKLEPKQAALGSGLIGISMYATAILSTAIGNLIYLNLSARDTILQLRTLPNLPSTSLTDFANLLNAGKPLNPALHNIPIQYHDFILTAAKMASIHAFNIVMLVTAIVAFIVGSLLSFYGIRD